MNTGASPSLDLGPQRGEFQRLGWCHSRGLDPPRGFFIWVWWLMLAVSWHLSWGSREHLHVASRHTTRASSPHGNLRATRLLIRRNRAPEQRPGSTTASDLTARSCSLVGHKHVAVLPQFKAAHRLQLGSQSMSETSCIFSKNKPLHHSIGNYLPSWLEASDGGGKM